MSMRGRFAARLEAVWYHGAPVPWWLGALETLYRRALGLRRALYASGWRRSAHAGVPTLVVGNVSVGGTGKTPLVAWLVQELRQRGWRPGVVMRGYRGAATAPLVVDAATDPALCGDEAALIARATRAPVAIARRRVEAARLLVARGACDVLVADDGLQHWALARDLEVAVVDGARRYGNGRLLPAGPLREPVARLDSVDFVVCNGTPRGGEIGMTVAGTRAVALTDPARAVALTALAGRRVHAVAGIGNPERFFRLLEDAGVDVVRHALPDHHDYDGSELDFGDELPVLVTEKDAVKCARYAHERVYVVPVQAELPADFAQAVHAALRRVRERPRTA
jgi:tetraacyldisaccharide 4'-kinase